MEYQISNRAKKVTLGLAVLGLIMLVLGFFQQKDYVYSEVIDEHSLIIKYNGELTDEKEKELKEKEERYKKRKAGKLSSRDVTSVTESSSNPLYEGMYDYDENGKKHKVRAFVPDDHNSITWIPS